jgi:DNA modification methylase
MNTHRIILGDCIEGMKTLPDGCVQTCITSPPYFGLRDYGGGDSEIGQEDTVDGYVQKMVEVFREVRRILRDDGTLWLNLGDSYMSAKNCAPPPQTQGGQRGMPSDFVPANRKDQKGLKTKDLIGIPWRVAFALQADGWYLRQDIIWSKPNPMPESVEDRCTKAHEYIFLLSKKPHYYYDFEAIKEPLAESSVSRLQQNIQSQTGSTRANGGAKTNGNMKAVGNLSSGLKNKRSVWTVNSKGYKGAHFAVYPENLIEPCVLAGCPVGGTVFDPFTGSGTTAVVALKNGRNYIGTELNPEYVKIAEERIKEAVPQTLEEILNG